MIIDIYHGSTADITMTASDAYFAHAPRDVEEVRAENHQQLLEMNPGFFDEYGPATARTTRPKPQLHRSGRRRTATATRNWRRA